MTRERKKFWNKYFKSITIAHFKSVKQKLFYHVVECWRRSVTLTRFFSSIFIQTGFEDGRKYDKCLTDFAEAAAVLEGSDAMQWILLKRTVAFCRNIHEALLFTHWQFFSQFVFIFLIEPSKDEEAFTYLDFQQ